ncbi:MAG: heme ABC transporter ATP-binding protein [Gammaproteobacteria bacterium]|nr:heme ABC transporter ATP-binding protein [Gammaproteobacteria bacterium]
MSIVISNLSYVIDESPLLQDITVRVQSGSIVAVVGPNGSGKTSLLKVVNGETATSGGRVMVDDEDTHSLSLQQRATRFGILPQQADLDFPFRVVEVVQMGRIPHQTSMRANQAVVDEVIEEMRLQNIRDRVYLTLSGGEKQRVQIARVLTQIWDAREHACLFLDEPTAALDLSHQLALFHTLESIAGMGTTIMVVLHDVNLALRFAHQVLLLSKGRLLTSGAPLDVLTPEKMREAFEVDIELFPTNDPARPFILTRNR